MKRALIVADIIWAALFGRPTPMDDEERRALQADLDGSWAQAEAGMLRPVEDVIGELGARYGGRAKDPGALLVASTAPRKRRPP